MTTVTNATGTVNSDLLSAVNTRKTATTTTTEDTKNQFLTMLTEQLKNQDP